MYLVAISVELYLLPTPLGFSSAFFWKRASLYSDLGKPFYDSGGSKVFRGCMCRSEPVDPCFQSQTSKIYSRGEKQMTAPRNKPQKHPSDDR